MRVRYSLLVLLIIGFVRTCPTISTSPDEVDICIGHDPSGQREGANIHSGLDQP